MSWRREFDRFGVMMDISYSVGLLRFSGGVILGNYIVESLIFLHRLMRIFVTGRS
jgi:hypothetical protein